MKSSLLLVLGVTGIAWMLSIDPTWFAQPHTVWSIRKEAIVLSGMLSYALMAWLMLLANRPARLERWLGGLDKLYWMHKWAGIYAAVLFFLHWMIKLVPKWLAGWGWIAAKPRGGSGSAALLGPQLTGLAKDAGEWTIYLMLALVAIALLRLIPYHWFRKVHRLFALAFLAVTFHAVVLLPVAQWQTPLGVLLLLSATVGSITAIRSLAGHIGRSRQHTGSLTGVERQDGGIVELHCTLDDAGMPHRPGQFAYLRIGDDGEPHPFSIVSAGDTPREVRFAIKDLGDDTRRMQILQPGLPVRIEGPYGRFDFADRGSGQVWVATGIGITPFLSRLDWLARHGGSKQPVSLFYCGGTPAGNPFSARLARLCQKAGVTLHWVLRDSDGPLTLAKILSDNRHASQSTLWYCGAQALGDALEKSWRNLGLPGWRFHRERFAMR
ncbi:ferric reductase-like transmembrane domain-containing protein [Jeongeupia naejangsanensis]|uniref:Ferric reductase-like transmembrane domain-containing protein n=1 Tax=Jeongeupia naejangsanensis TaxID=613195 RepID=A0ABS2BG68_9NEIS|nr:ferric reductase-like transmembrane domain-containing protein [Jeongeupia naejangsanensis]MBM3114603.1 ferric reductase-like transmembrane domain-containing protein [Jeongeupia naejangsanensis]